MATHQEQLDRAVKVREAKRKLLVALLKDDFVDAATQRGIINENLPLHLRYSLGFSHYTSRAIKAAHPWFKDY